MLIYTYCCHRNFETQEHYQTRESNNVLVGTCRGCGPGRCRGRHARGAPRDAGRAAGPWPG